MRILFVQESDWLKRGPHQQHQLADRLSLRGHEIRVIDFPILWRADGKSGFCSKRQVFDNVFKVSKEAKVTVIRPGIVRIPMLDYISLLFTHRKEIERQIGEFRPDVIVGFGILNSYLAAKAAQRSGIPFIYYWIDVLHELVPLKPLRPIAKLVEGVTLKRADVVLAINEKLRDYVAGMGAPPKKVKVLRAGIDVEQFKPSVNGGAVRGKYGIGKNDTVLFFMGWLYNFSGLKEVALSLAETGDRNVKLLVVGEGDAYSELQRIRGENGLQDRLILTGKKLYEEMPALIAASDVCLLPAYPNEKIMQNIVPIKVYEYMAMAKPVISTRLPGVMREFGRGNGVVYVGKPGDVVGKAVELARSGNLKELGGRARRFVEGHSWDTITDEFGAILKNTVKEKKHGRLFG